MEHFESLYNVLLDFIGEDSMPNSAELLGMYGRVGSWLSRFQCICIISCIINLIFKSSVKKILVLTSKIF